jgi:hypothetical protein
MVSGPVPKPADQRVSRREPAHGWIDIPDVPYRGKGRPKLPADVPNETLEWWIALTTMPHCVLWTKTDWQYAALTATIHAAVVNGDLARAAELRIREMQMGVTLDSRRALRIRYVSADHEPKNEDEEPSSRVTDFAEERRKRALAEHE